MKNYEKILLEFRLAKRPLTKRLLDPNGLYSNVTEIVGHHYIVQQKWQVQDGPYYTPADYGPPNRESDIYVGVIDGSPVWCPCKYEWRDLPIVEDDKL